MWKIKKTHQTNLPWGVNSLSICVELRNLQRCPSTEVPPQSRRGAHCQPEQGVLGTCSRLFATCRAPSALGSEVAGWGSPCAAAPGTRQRGHGFPQQCSATGRDVDEPDLLLPQEPQAPCPRAGAAGLTLPRVSRRKLLQIQCS